MAKKTKEVDASIKIYTTDAVTGKKVTVGKIKLPTMSLDSASEKLTELLTEAGKDGATSLRGTLTLYKSAE